MNRRLLAAILAGLLMSIGIAVPAQAALCHQSSCNGQDPGAKQCNDTSSGNLASFYYNGSDPYLAGVLLELRRSRNCDAAWARTTGLDCLPMWRPCGFVLQVQGGTEQLGGGPGGGQKWTNMWSFRQYVRACFIIWTTDDSYRTDGCTGWH
ncbi:hypothetical protein [Polymorphospora lycopeni]|uniref:DUF2690 domain-containing protein n=2 Tax=Polymorphospora TaxID=338583 RepID=A0ABV5CV79_9ACTN